MTVHTLFDEFVAAHRAGEHPDFHEFVRRAGTNSTELRLLLLEYLEEAPPAPVTAVTRTRAAELVAAARAAAPAQPALELVPGPEDEEGRLRLLSKAASGVVQRAADALRIRIGPLDPLALAGPRWIPVSAASGGVSMEVRVVARLESADGVREVSRAATIGLDGWVDVEVDVQSGERVTSVRVEPAGPAPP